MVLHTLDQFVSREDFQHACVPRCRVCFMFSSDYVEEIKEDKSSENANITKDESFINKQDEILRERMKLARVWIGIGIIYYIFKAPMIILPLWDIKTTFEKGL